MDGERAGSPRTCHTSFGSNSWRNNSDRGQLKSSGTEWAPAGAHQLEDTVQREVFDPPRAEWLIKTEAYQRSESDMVGLNGGTPRDRNHAVASTLARICCQRRGRRFTSSTFLRRRIDFGVTSTYSSSAMNSIADSRVSTRCGTSRMASSAVEARMLVCFFSLVTLTSISASRAFSPTIMPS